MGWISVSCVGAHWICHREDVFLFHPVSISRKKPEIMTERHTGGSLGLGPLVHNLGSPFGAPSEVSVIRRFTGAHVCRSTLQTLGQKSEKLQQ